MRRACADPMREHVLPYGWRAAKSRGPISAHAGGMVRRYYDFVVVGPRERPSCRKEAIVNVRRPIQLTCIAWMLFVLAAQSAPVLGNAGSLPVYPHRTNSWYQGHYDSKATTAQLEVAP